MGLKAETGKNRQLTLQHSSAPAVLHSTNEAFLANIDDAGLWQRLHQRRDLARLQNLLQATEFETALNNCDAPESSAGNKDTHSAVQAWEVQSARICRYMYCWPLIFANKACTGILLMLTFGFNQSLPTPGTMHVAGMHGAQL